MIPIIIEVTAIISLIAPACEPTIILNTNQHGPTRSEIMRICRSLLIKSATVDKTEPRIARTVYHASQVRIPTAIITTKKPIGMSTEHREKLRGFTERAERSGMSPVRVYQTMDDEASATALFGDMLSGKRTPEREIRASPRVVLSSNLGEYRE